MCAEGSVIVLVQLYDYFIELRLDFIHRVNISDGRGE